VRAFEQRCREFTPAAPRDAAVPGSFRFVLASFAVLPAPLRRERQDRERGLIAGVTNFGILAEKSDESGSIDKHFQVLLFLAPDSLGAPESERDRSQSQGLLFRGDRQAQAERSAAPQDGGGAETLQGRRVEAEDRRAAGRGQAEFAVKRSECPRDEVTK